MMAAALVHLLAESNKALSSLSEAQEGSEAYPWAMVLCGVGFIITLVAAHLLEPGTEETRCIECDAECEFAKPLAISPGAALLSKGLSGTYEKHAWHEQPLDHSHCHHGETSGSAGAVDPESRPADGFPGPQEPLIAAKAPPSSGKVGSFVLATGLAIHSAIEGAAIGAQKEYHSVIKIALAVLAHKGLTAYAVGSSLMASMVTTAQYISYVSFFSLSTPVGIVFGTALSCEVEGAAWAAGFSAVASGTFLYSAVVEVLGNEMRQECFEPGSVHRTARAKILKLIVFIIGFAAMSVVSKFA
mmetsp:Transcript_31330/g.74456  ORF Transcript_31330/g.74456 Transcript_31330/m.74456 type:complete len:301 (+) Transcript_31330:769-1671(+)